MFAIIDSDLPRLQQGKLVLPLQQRCEDSGLYFELTLPSADKTMTLSAPHDANLWHRRMDHRNAESQEHE